MSLSDTQDWLWSSILAADDAEADKRLHAGAIPAAARLGIYARGYRLRLLECLRAEFPAVRHLLGEPLFDNFCGLYLSARPSTSYTLHDLGSGFPVFLQEQRPDLDKGRERENWIDFLLDLATVERCMNEVFNGPGDENATPAADAAPQPAASLRLLALSHPVHLAIDAVNDNRDIPPVAPAATWLAVARRDFRVFVEPLTAVEFDFYQRIRRGETAAVLQDIGRGIGPGGVEQWLALQRRRGLLR